MEKAARPCHTCHRRRVKCDQSLPSCKKCHISHHECLGYQKLFLWNLGVASRGKMIGKTFPTAPVTLSIDKPGPLNVTSLSLPTTIATATNSKIEHVPARSAQAMFLQTRLVSSSPYPGLDDPHFHYLSTVQRYYLQCFGTDIQQSLALYNMPAMNPFQSFVQYAEHHELLRQIIIATAALYACRMYHATDVGSTRSLPHAQTVAQSSENRKIWAELCGTRCKTHIRIRSKRSSGRSTCLPKQFRQAMSAVTSCPPACCCSCTLN